MSANAHWGLCTAILLAASACASSTPPTPPASPTLASSPEQAQPQPQPSRFDWPMSVAIPVRETTRRGDSQVELTYQLHVCPAGPETFTIAHRDLQFASVDGVPGDDPSLAPQMRRMAPVFSAIPELVIGRDGKYRGVRGWDEVLHELEAALPDGPHEGLSRLRDDPRARALTEEAVGDRWRTWVESWLDFDPAKGSDQTETRPVRLGSKPIPLVVQTQSKPADRAGSLHIASSTRAGGRKARAILDVLLGAPKGAVPDPESFEVEVILIRDVETQWPSLRP